MLRSLRSRSPLALLATACVLATGLTLSSARSVDDHEDESPMAVAMDGIQGAMRNLRGVLADPEQKGRAMEVLHGMQGHAISVLGMEPFTAEGKEGDERAAFVVGFRRQMVALLDQLYAIELAVIEERADDAQAGFKALMQTKKAGHDTYQ